MLSTSNKHQLLAAHQRGQDFLHSGSGNLSSGSGNPKLPYNKEEASCNEMDPVWSAKVSAMWLSGTRPSENKKDELQNPKDRSDPRIYRTRFLEMGLEPMLNWMNETGRREVCPEFSVGRRFMTLKLEAFLHQETGPRIFAVQVPHGVDKLVPCTQIVEQPKPHKQLSPCGSDIRRAWLAKHADVCQS